MNQNPINVYIADVAQIKVGKPLMAWPVARNAAELIKTSPVASIVHTEGSVLVTTDEGWQYLVSNRRK